MSRFSLGRTDRALRRWLGRPTKFFADQKLFPGCSFLRGGLCLQPYEPPKRRTSDPFTTPNAVGKVPHRGLESRGHFRESAKTSKKSSISQMHPGRVALGAGHRRRYQRPIRADRRDRSPSAQWTQERPATTRPGHHCPGLMCAACWLSAPPDGIDPRLELLLALPAGLALPDDHHLKLTPQ